MLCVLGLVGVQACPRHGAQALVRDGPAARFTQTVRPLVEASQGVVDLFEQFEVMLRHRDAVVVLDCRAGHVGRVARVALEQALVFVLVALFVLSQDVKQMLSLGLQRVPELLALSRRQRSLIVMRVHARSESNSDASTGLTSPAVADGTPHAPLHRMTRAEEFKTLAERSGRPKHASKRKPKKSAWSHAKAHAGAKATHALEVTATGRPSRKSTRASANRAKADAPMNLTEESRKGSPPAVARKAQIKRERVRGKPASA